MSCPKNIRNHKFLWWKWTSEGYHDFELTRIGKFMYCSDNFETSSVCRNCHTRKETHFTEMEDLIRDGYSVDILNDITPRKAYYPGQF